MTLRSLHHADSFVYQQSGEDNSVPVIYLPGVHGCWTSLDKLRPRLNANLRLIEVAYPLLDNWTLEHFSDALLTLMHQLHLDSAHLVGESFGSLIGWKFGLMHPSRVRSLTLVGGFCQAPGMYLAATAGLGLSVVPSAAFDKAVDTYVSIKNRQGESRKAEEGAKPYPAVRGSRGQKATANRMRLIQQSDFRKLLILVSFPVRYIGGEKDRVIPVAREIKTLSKQLPPGTSFESHLIKGAPHVIIATNPSQTGSHITQWVLDIESHGQ